MHELLLLLINYKIMSSKLYFVNRLKSYGCTLIRFIKLIKMQQIYFLTSV